MDIYKQHKLRQREQAHRRRKALLYAVQSVFSSILIVGGAILFDVPQRIGQKIDELRGVRPPAEQLAEQPATIPARPAEPPPSTPRQIVTRPRETSPPQEPEIRRNALPGRAVERIVPTEPKQEPERIVHLLDIDLAKKSLFLLAADLGAGSVDLSDATVEGLSGTDLALKLRPENGVLAAGSQVEVLFDAYPRLRLLVEYERRGPIERIRVSPQMDLAADEPLPFTKSKLADIAASTRRRGNALLAELDSVTAERDRLSAWIKAPVKKSLEARGQAKLRVNLLNTEIPRLQKAIELAAADVTLIESLESAFAQLRGTSLRLSWPAD